MLSSNGRTIWSLVVAVLLGMPVVGCSKDSGASKEVEESSSAESPKETSKGSPKAEAQSGNGEESQAED